MKGLSEYQVWNYISTAKDHAIKGMQVLGYHQHEA